MARGPVHYGAGSHHAVPVGGDGFGLDSMKLHGAKFFRITTFLPYAVPAVVSTLVWGSCTARNTVWSAP